MTRPLHSRAQLLKECDDIEAAITAHEDSILKIDVTCEGFDEAILRSERVIAQLRDRVRAARRSLESLWLH